MQGPCSRADDGSSFWEQQESCSFYCLLGPNLLSYTSSKHESTHSSFGKFYHQHLDLKVLISLHPFRRKQMLIFFKSNYLCHNWSCSCCPWHCCAFNHNFSLKIGIFSSVLVYHFIFWCWNVFTWSWTGCRSPPPPSCQAPRHWTPRANLPLWWFSCYCPTLKRLTFVLITEDTEKTRVL